MWLRSCTFVVPKTKGGGLVLQKVRVCVKGMLKGFGL